MNTYHLWLRPGPELVAELGGLHGFARWPHAIATDSGGFQAFSLAERTQVTEEGFEFRRTSTARACSSRPRRPCAFRAARLRHRDAARRVPARARRHAPSSRPPSTRTTRWAERCLAAQSPGQALFGIVQGGTNVELRLAHAEELGEAALRGLALGGFSVGEPTASMHARSCRSRTALPARARAT